MKIELVTPGWSAILRGLLAFFGICALIVLSAWSLVLVILSLLALWA